MSESANKKSKKLFFKRLKDFLESCKIVDKENKDVSHTKLGSKSIGEFCAKYKVPDEHKDFFYKLYTDWVFKLNLNCYLTEKHHPDYSPVLIDLDFRYPMSEDDKIVDSDDESDEESGDEEEVDVKWKRKYTSRDLQNFLEIYFEILDEVLEIPPEHKVAYVMEKSAPIYDKEKKTMKDGVHIIMPHIVSSYAPLFYARNKILKNEKAQQIFQKLGFTNPIEDIVDEAVIQRNNWFMYGSKKPGKEPYLVTSVIKYQTDTKGFKIQKSPKAKKMLKLVKLFSVYDFQSDGICLVKNPKLIENDLKKIEAKKNKPKMKKKMGKQNKTTEDLKIIEKLVSVLDESRAEKYDDWIRLGWCLHNIDYSLCEVWDEFSQHSAKYKEGYCQEEWDKMDNDGLEIGSLHRWAQKDSPKEYKKILREDLTNLIKASLNQTDYDIARVVHRMFKHEFVCVSPSKKMWFQFKNHRWVEIDGATELRRKLSEDVSREYTNLALICNSQLIGSIDDDGYDEMVNQRETLERRIVVANKLALKLKQEPFKNNVISACSSLFHDSKFLEKLDSNVDLIGFNNGVYDLKRGEFREGYPEDNISFSTQIDYEHLSDDNPLVLQVHEFLEQVLPIPRVKDYVLKILGSVLSGKTGQEKFHIWTGCHAKGTPILMYDGRSVKVENLVVGDSVMGPDSKPRTIRKLVNGKANMYRVTTKSHQPFVVNEHHMLSLQAVDTTNIRHLDNSDDFEVWWQERDIYNLPVWRNKLVSGVLDSQQMEAFWSRMYTEYPNMIKPGDIVDVPLKEYLNKKDIMCGRYLLYSKEVSFPHQETTIDPYLLGYLLGGNNNTYISAKNNRVVNKLNSYENLGFIIPLEGKRKKNYQVIWDSNKDSLYQKLKYLDLINNQYIPREFLINSEKVRLQVLAGLIDRKAIFKVKHNQYIFKNLSKNLEEDVLFLCRSLGMEAYLKNVKDSKYLYAKPSYYQGIPVLIDNKCNNNSSEYSTGLYEFKMEQLPEDDYFGFTVDQDHLYLTDDFLVHHNCGGNGKSKIIELFELAFGDYCGKLSVTNVTQKRPASNACTPELLKNKGKRFVTLQEPDDDEQIHVGAMKELTGGDKIQARGLHKDPIEFKPQWKIVMTSNVLPSVSANDNGTWRRIRVTEFISRFMEPKDMKPGKKYQFPIDYDLSTKLQQWPEAFMNILIKAYHNFDKNGLVEPPEVLKNTEAYKEESDCMLQFINECLEESPGEKIKIDETYFIFKEWYKNSGNTNKLPSKKDLKTNVSNMFGNPDSKNYWRGVTFVNQNEDDDDDEDD